MMKFAMYAMLVFQLNDPSWVVRRDAEERLVRELCADPVNNSWVLEATETPEARWRASRVRDRYRDVKGPERIPSEDWWGLYTRVTGIREQDVGHFFGVMPTGDDENAMRELWVKDRFREGYSRMQVIEMVKGMQ